MRSVLVACEDPNRRRSYESLLREAGCRAVLESDPRAVVERALAEGAVAIVSALGPIALDLLAEDATARCPDVPLLALAPPDAPRPERQRAQVVYVDSRAPDVELAREIAHILQRQHDGGTLHAVSAGMFLQVLEMEHRTCTIRLTDQATGRAGVLFFREGELVDARLYALRGDEAARGILRWRQVDLAIQNACPAVETRLIRRSLESLILDAVRLQDESGEESGSKPTTGRSPPHQGQVQQANRVQGLQRRLEERLGPRAGVLDAYAAPSNQNLLAALTHVGRDLSLGDAEVAHFSRSDKREFLWLASAPPVVFEVDPKAPRDRLLQAARSALHENGGDT